MIELGTLIKEVGWGYGIVIGIHKTNGCSSFAYEIKWLDDGTSGRLAAWQFEVVA